FTPDTRCPLGPSDRTRRLLFFVLTAFCPRSVPILPSNRSVPREAYRLHRVRRERQGHGPGGTRRDGKVAGRGSDERSAEERAGGQPQSGLEGGAEGDGSIGGVAEGEEQVRPAAEALE